MATTAVEALVRELEAANQRLSKALEGISEKGLHTLPAPGEWSVAQVCAHVIEMEPMWMEKISKLRQQPELARTPAEVERRTAALREHANDDAATVRRRLAEAKAKALATLRAMKPADLEVKGKIETARESVFSKVINHIIEHADQVTASRKVAMKS